MELGWELALFGQRCRILYGKRYYITNERYNTAIKNTATSNIATVAYGTRNVCNTEFNYWYYYGEGATVTRLGSVAVCVYGRTFGTKKFENGSKFFSCSDTLRNERGLRYWPGTNRRK